MKLTDTQCKNAKPESKAKKLSDGKGLYLEVTPSGSKYWRLKYRINGKEKRLALGVYPEVSLKQARIATDKARELIAQNIDPSREKQIQKESAKQKADNTFQAVALEFYEVKKDIWSKGYANKVIRCLERNLFPYIGGYPIEDITPPDILKCLRKVEDRKAYDIAKKTKQISAMVFRYGIQTGKCKWNATENLQGALKPINRKHFKAFDVKDIPEFIAALERNEARLYERTRRAVWLSLYLFQRPVEIRTMQWSEINFDTKELCIPASKMKMRRDHIVPLSDQAIEILKEQKVETDMIDTDFVFPSQVRPKQPLSDGTVNKAIQRLGFGHKATAHGFRALARTTIREKLGYDSEVIEKQIAHKTRNPLGEAYDRTQFLEVRKKMMQDWADFVDATSSENTVIHARFK